MPFSGGTYTLPSGNPVTTETTISITWANNTLDDIATALSTAMLKDGTQVITANIPMSSFKFTGLAAGSAAGDSLRYEQVFTTGNVTLLGELRTTAATSLTATGTGQSDALQLTSAVNYVTTAASGTGVKLYASPGAGSMQVVYNGGANPLVVYPQTSGTINQLAANVGHIVPTNTTCIYWAASSTAWAAMMSR